MRTVGLHTICGIASVLGVGLAGLARDADERADPVGTWECQYMIGDLKRTSTLTIKRDADKLAGTMSWPGQKETPLKVLKWAAGELTFSAERVVGEAKIPVEYKFTIDADDLKGKGTVESDGKKTDFEITGKRDKKDK
jgi:hypothetical protein